MDPVTQSSQTTPKANHSAPMSPTVILEPTTVTVPENVPWYRKIFGGGQSRTQNVWRLSFVMVFLFAVLATMRYQSSPTTTVTKADLNHAKVSLLPKEGKVPPDTFVQIWVTADATVTKGEFIVSFDPNKLTIAEVKAGEGSQLTGALSWTPLVNANKSGLLSVQFNPAATNVTPPTGTFQLANLTVRKKTQSAKGTSEVSLVKDAIRLFHDQAPFSVTADSTTTVTIGATK